MTLLNIPGFIERLCKLATRKVSEATGANFLQELEDWYTWLDNALVLDALMQMATEEAEQSSTGETTAHFCCQIITLLKSYQFWLRLFCFFPLHLQNHQMRVHLPPALWDIDCLSLWRSSMRSCIKLKCSMCCVSFLWADRGTRYLTEHVFPAWVFSWAKLCVSLTPVLCPHTGAQDAGWVPAHPGAQQPVWQADLEKIHGFKSCGAWPEWELRL